MLKVVLSYGSTPTFLGLMGYSILLVFIGMGQCCIHLACRKLLYSKLNVLETLKHLKCNIQLLYNSKWLVSCTAPFHVKNNVSYTPTSSWWWHNSIVCRGDLLLIRIYHFQRSSTNLTKNVFLLVVCPHVCVAVQRRICQIFKYKILFGLNRWHLYPFPVNPRCERWAWKTHIALLHCLQN